MVKPVPDGYHTVTPYLIVEGASKLIDFAKQAFGAEETVRMPGPGGTIGHAEIRIGDSFVMLSDGAPTIRRACQTSSSTSTTATLHIRRRSRPGASPSASRLTSSSATVPAA